MKNVSKLLIPIVLVGIFMVCSSSCKDAVEKAAYTCADAPTDCGNIKCCANSSGAGYYEVDGVKYTFTAATITEAAQAAAAAACATKSPSEKLESQLQLEDFANIQIEEAKTTE